MRVLFTGGSGMAGRHVVEYLVNAGHRVVNLDRVGMGNPKVRDILVDLTDLGQVFSAFQAYATATDIEDGKGHRGFDAVVHFAASVPHGPFPVDSETYRINVMSTFNILEAAAKMGIPNVIFGSSEVAYGICLVDGVVDPKWLPFEEDYPIDPTDCYGISKRVNEVTAEGYQRRTGADIIALRIGNVMTPESYGRFPGFAKDPGARRRLAFSYIDARDLGQIVDLCLKRQGHGYEVFNASADNNSVPQPNSELLVRFFPNVPLRRPVDEEEGLLSNRKAREVLGFRMQHNWKSYVTGS
jgi:nucleoside-diphosphate-sugar epimerase